MRRKRRFCPRPLDLLGGGDALDFHAPIVVADQRRDGTIGTHFQRVRRPTEAIARVILRDRPRRSIDVSITAHDASPSVGIGHRVAQAVFCWRRIRPRDRGVLGEFLQPRLLRLPCAIQFFAGVAGRLVRAKHSGPGPFPVGTAGVGIAI